MTNFPWARYRRRVGIVFSCAVIASLSLMLATSDGRLSLETVLIAFVDSAVIAVVVAFPLARRIARGPQR